MKGWEVIMRRILAVLAIVAGVSMLAVSGAGAHAAPPCNDSGGPGNSDYARHHIVEATPGHVPGTHGGFSLCLGTGRTVHKP